MCQLEEHIVQQIKNIWENLLFFSESKLKIQTGIKHINEQESTNALFLLILIILTACVFVACEPQTHKVWL